MIDSVILFLCGIVVMGAGLALAIPMVDHSDHYYPPMRWTAMGALWVAGFLIQLKANQELKLI